MNSASVFAPLIALAQLCWVIPTMSAVDSSVPTEIIARVGPAGITYITADGRSLYTYARDTNGTSSCIDTCAQMWPPLQAPPDAVAHGDWAPVVRSDGSMQWSWRGQPLYTYVKDVPGTINHPGTAFGEGLAVNAWATAFDPLFTPPGVKVAVTPAGRTLVDWRGDPLYWRMSGDMCDDDCVTGWVPFGAPMVAVASSGDWSIVSAVDGTRYWSFQGRPLYRSELQTPESSNKLLDSNWSVAVLEPLAPPPEWVTVRSTDMGDVYANSEGLTLYTGPSDLERINRVICDSACVAEAWALVSADPDARGAGFWSIVKDSNGRNTWAYRGDALYLHLRDKKPGDIGGAGWAKGIFGTGWQPIMADGSNIR